MYYVYFLKSLIKSNWVYVGFINNINRRFQEHKSGMSEYTKPYIPLKLEGYIALSSEVKAKQLEKYLKVGSGKAILKKRILSDEVLTSHSPFRSLNL